MMVHTSLTWPDLFLAQGVIDRSISASEKVGAYTASDNALR